MGLKAFPRADFDPETQERVRSKGLYVRSGRALDGVCNWDQVFVNSWLRWPLQWAHDIHSGYHCTQAIVGRLSDWGPHRLMVNFWAPSTLKFGQQRPSKNHLLWSHLRVHRCLIMDLHKSCWQKSTWTCSGLDTVLKCWEMMSGNFPVPPHPCSPPPTPVMALWSHPLRQTLKAEWAWCM